MSNIYTVDTFVKSLYTQVKEKGVVQDAWDIAHKFPGNLLANYLQYIKLVSPKKVVFFSIIPPMQDKQVTDTH